MSVRVAYIVVITTLIVLSLAIIGNSMTKPVSRDEHMYCTGAVLMAQGKMIYRDFSYAAQMPYHPLLCAMLFRLFGTTHYLLTVRLLSCACDILVVLCIIGIYRHVFKSSETAGTLLGLGSVVLYAFNPLVDYANGYAWNHDVVILCVVASFWLFMSIDSEQRSKYRRIAAVGALLTFAAWMRATTVLVEFLFFVILLSLPAGSIKQRLVTVLPFLMAPLLVSIWPLTVIARAPRAFFLNIVKIPTLYGQWLREIGMVFDKLALTLSCLTKPGYLVLIVLTVCLYLAVFFQRRNLKIENSRMPILAFLLPIAFFVIALIPPTMWSQYHAIPVPFLIISLAFPLRHLRETLVATGSSSRPQIVCVLLALCVLITLVSPSMGLHPMLPSSHVPSYHTVIARILKLRDLQNWVPLEVHRVSRDIAEKTREPKLVLTLAPLFALEGGCEIYTQLSCGSVIYRAADALSADDQAITNTVGQATIGKLIEERPPSAVILGMERGKLAGLETPLKGSIGVDWERKDYEFGPAVHFRP